MSKCLVCGKMNQYGECDDCLARYREDMRTGHVPPAFLEAGIQFEFSDWMHVKEEEARWERLGMSPERARAQVRLVCSNRAYYRQCQSHPLTAAQTKKAADDAIKRRSTY